MRRAFFLSFAVVIASACAELPVIERGTCGNFVLETGEDCDTPDAGSFACRSCRFDCTDRPCPTGYGCGADFTCRKPTGAFNLSGPEIPVATLRLETADFDGDRRADVVAETVAEFRIHYFDGRADPTRTASILGASPHAISLLTTKPLATLATCALNNVNVWRGQPDRTLQTTLYPALAVASIDARIFTADVLPASTGREYVADEYLLGLPLGIGSTLHLGTYDPLKQPFFPFTSTLDKVIGPVFGNFFGGLYSCDTMVFAYSGTATVFFFPLCANFGTAKIATFTSRGISRVIAGFIDGDNLLDIAMQSPTTTLPIEVAWGTANGFTPTQSQNGLSITGSLLAVGDVDGDKSGDWVEANGVPLATTKTLVTAKLTKAMVRDVNGDGFADIVGIGPGGAWFFFGTGTALLTPSFSPLDGTPSQLVVSDFDGDRVDDVLVGTNLGTESSKLWIQWGRSRQFPEPPIAIGTLPSRNIQDMSGGTLLPYLSNGASTSATAVALILTRRSTPPQALEAPVLFGSPSRVLQSPFGITKVTMTGQQKGQVVMIVAGHFAGSDHEGLALVTQDDDDTSSSHGFRLWSAPSTEDAQLDPSTLVRSTQLLPLASPIDLVETSPWDRPLGTAIDLDVDGIDELVLLAPPQSTTDRRKGALIVARLGADGFSSQAQDIGAAAKFTAPLWMLRAADLDGDGKKDVILLFTDAPNHWVVRVVVTRGDGKLDLSRALDVVLPMGEIPTDVAALRTDPASARRTLAIVTADHVHLAAWTKDGSAFDTPSVLPAGGSTIAAGDIDGDGVDDLVVGRALTVSVWFQRAAGEK